MEGLSLYLFQFDKQLYFAPTASYLDGHFCRFTPVSLLLQSVSLSYAGDDWKAVQRVEAR